MSLDKRFKHWVKLQKSEDFNDIHDLNQNPDVYTASAIPDILGCGGGSANYQYRVRTNLIMYKNKDYIPALQHGKACEEPARNHLTGFLGDAIVTTCGTVVHPNYPWLMASPDAMAVHEDGLLNIEIKCPLKYATIPQTIEKLPGKYLVQVLVQQMCLPTQHSILYFWHEEGHAIYYVPHYAELAKYIIQTVGEFRERVKSNAGNPPKKSRDSPIDEFIVNFRSKCIKIG